MDEIKGIGGKLIGQLPGAPGSTSEAKGTGDFNKALTDAIGKVNEVQKDADKAVEALTQGKATLHETMIAVEKAGISFQLMLQVRNKIVTAYEDIMRTQV